MTEILSVPILCDKIEPQLTLFNPWPKSFKSLRTIFRINQPGYLLTPLFRRIILWWRLGLHHFSPDPGYRWRSGLLLLPRTRKSICQALLLILDFWLKQLIEHQNLHFPILWNCFFQQPVTKAKLYPIHVPYLEFYFLSVSKMLKKS